MVKYPISASISGKPADMANEVLPDHFAVLMKNAPPYTRSFVILGVTEGQNR